MVADRLETEWHLTPNGWMHGTTRFFGHIQGEAVEPPPDRVLTVVHEIYQRSEWSSEERSVHEIWRSPSADSAMIGELRRQFSAPFRD